MPFNGNVYTPPTGAENASPGIVVQSAIWNSIFTDMASALTQLATQANTTPSFSNLMMSNGGFAVWQRGAGGSASFSVSASTTQYTADRWYIITGANQACTVAQATGLTAAAPPGHACKVTRNSGQTGTTAITFGFPFTSTEIERLRGQVVSLTAAAKSGANWSPASGTLTYTLLTGTGTQQKAGAAGANFSNVATVLTVAVNLAVSTTNLAISGTSTGTVATNVTQGELQITWMPVGTAGTDDSITFDQMGLFAGSVVQGFTDAPFDECLRQCKFFYRKSFPYAVAPAQNAGLPGAVSFMSQAATQAGLYVNFEPTEMLATAAFTSYSPSGATANWIDNTTAVSLAASFDTAAPSAKGVLIIAASVSAADHLCYIHYSADAGL